MNGCTCDKCRFSLGSALHLLLGCCNLCVAVPNPAGAYACLKCRFFDDDLAKQPFHCEE